MKKEKKVWAITLIACWLLPPVLIQAQDSLRTMNLDEVVVTATKFPKSRNETGKVLTVIGEDQIRESKGKSISQLLNEQPGIVVNGANSNAGKDKSIYLQGAGSGYTLVLVDGIPINDPSGINGGAYDLRLLSLDQVERIEVLKGSQSTLYGSDAIAGVINVITKRGTGGPFSGNATLGYGSYNTDKESVSVFGAVKAVDYQAQYSHFNTRGISEASDPENAKTFDKDGASQDAWQLNVGYKLSAKLSVRPYLRYNRFKGKYDGGTFLDNTLNRYDAQLVNTGATAQYLLKKGSVNLLYGYDGSERNYISSFPANYKGKFHVSEIYVNHEIHRLVQLLAGAQVQRWQMTDANAAVHDPTVNILSPYVSVHAKSGTGLFLEAGARHNQHSLYGGNLTYSINPSWVLKNGVKIFVNQSTGFKAPTLTQLYGQYGANPDLKPEKSTSLEGGVQWFSGRGRVSMLLNYFDRRVKDVIIYTPAYAYDNFDEQHDHGVEFEPVYKVNNNLSLKFSYTYVTGQVKTKVNGEDSKYYNLFRRPKHSLSANATARLGRVSGSLSVRYFGQRTDRYFDSTDFLVKDAALSAYTLVDVYGEYQLTTRISLFVDAKNLLDKKYQEVYGYNTFRFNFMTGINVKVASK